MLFSHFLKRKHRIKRFARQKYKTSIAWCMVIRQWTLLHLKIGTFLSVLFIWEYRTNFILYVCCLPIVFSIKWLATLIELYAFHFLRKLFRHEYEQLLFTTQFYFDCHIAFFCKLLSNKVALVTTGKNQPRHRICSHRILTGNGWHHTLQKRSNTLSRFYIIKFVWTQFLFTPTPDVFISILLFWLNYFLIIKR